HSFIHSDIKSQSINLKHMWPDLNDFWIYPQEFILLIGDTGINKSAFMQNLILKSGLTCLYIDNEVGDRLMYRRFIQIKNNMTKTEVNEYYKHNSNSLSSSISQIQYISKRIHLNDL